MPVDFETAEGGIDVGVEDDGEHDQEGDDRGADYRERGVSGACWCHD